MKWDQIYIFSRQFIFTPSKTFQSLIKAKNLNNYLIGISIFNIVYGLVNYLLFPASIQHQTVTNPTPAVLASTRFFEGITTFSHDYALFLAILGWILVSAVIFIFARIFSKTGNFKLILVANGLVTLMISLPSLLLRWLYLQLSLPVLNLVIQLISIWSIYLTILAISIIFMVSKKKALIIFFLPVLIIFLIIMTSLFMTVAKSLPSR